MGYVKYYFVLIHLLCSVEFLCSTQWKNIYSTDYRPKINYEQHKQKILFEKNKNIHSQKDILLEKLEIFEYQYPKLYRYLGLHTDFFWYSVDDLTDYFNLIYYQDIPLFSVAQIDFSFNLKEFHRKKVILKFKYIFHRKQKKRP